MGTSVKIQLTLGCGYTSLEQHHLQAAQTSLLGNVLKIIESSSTGKLWIKSYIPFLLMIVWFQWLRLNKQLTLYKELVAIYAKGGFKLTKTDKQQTSISGRNTSGPKSKVGDRA